MTTEHTVKRKKYIVTGIVYILVLLAAHTQLVAYLAHYHPSLGFNVKGIYPPWQIALWALIPKLTAATPHLRLALSSMTLFMSLGALLTMFLRSKSRDTSTLHGSARFATTAEIAKSGLLEPKEDTLPLDSVVIGGLWLNPKAKTKFRYLTHSGPEHILTYAPTRSGKGVGLVVPTLLSWKHSTVITDLKGELWALTAGWRQKEGRNHAIRFEPAAEPKDTASWNPLHELRTDARLVGDAQNLATLIVDPDGKGLKDHWAKTAYALLTGVIIHAVLSQTNNSLAGLDALLSPAKGSIQKLFEDMQKATYYENGPHPVAAAAAQDMIDRPPTEAGSVLSTAKSYLALYRDPFVATNTSTSTFRIRDLMRSEKAASLYIITQPTDKARLRPLVRIIINMVIRLLAGDLEFEGGRPKPTYNHRMLLMLDEFPSLGKLGILEESLAFLAGYGIKAYLICQDINQLKSADVGYGRDETITSNCHIQNAYPPNRMETAEHLSKILGDITAEDTQTSWTKQGGFGKSRSRQDTVTKTKRPLRTPDEIRRLPGPQKGPTGDILKGGDMLVIPAAQAPIYGTQPLYFKDPELLRRAAIPAPKQSDEIRRHNVLPSPDPDQDQPGTTHTDDTNQPATTPKTETEGQATTATTAKVAIACISALLLSLALFTFGTLYSTGASAPQGLYLRLAPRSAINTIGAFALYPYVRFRDYGIPRRAQTIFPGGQPLVIKRIAKIKSDRLWLRSLTDTPTVVDSRNFGWIPKRAQIYTLQPLWTRN